MGESCLDCVAVEKVGGADLAQSASKCRGGVLVVELYGKQGAGGLSWCESRKRASNRKEGANDSDCLEMHFRDVGSNDGKALKQKERQQEMMNERAC